ncbi:MAG: hypothetical protein IAE65_12560 [Ignavibacteria bacterium]|nr:hypothetical protein [Ignavibacteria bacterium]
MKPTEDLFELINSLTKSEKRYFRIYSTLLSGKRKQEMNYLKLFNEIEKQCKTGIYDEKKIKEKFKGNNFIKQLTFTKNYLYNLILKSLFNFYSDNSPDFISALGVFKQRLLYKKGLYNQYFRGFKSVNLNLEKYERYGQLTDNLKMERVIVKIKRRKKNLFDNSVYYDKEKEYINKIENLTDYSKLLNKIYTLQREQGLIRTDKSKKKLNEIKRDNLISNENEPKSKRALEYYYLSKILINELENNFEECLKLSIKRLELTINFPDAFADSIINVKSDSLDLILKYSLIKNDFETYNKYLKLQSEVYGSKINEAKIFFECNKELEYLKNRKSEEPAEIKEKIMFIKGAIEKHEKSFFKDFILEFYFWAMIYFLEFDEAENALKFCNLILNNEIKNSRTEISNLAGLFNLLIHYRLGNKNLLIYLIKSTEYNLKKTGEISIPEKTIIFYLKKLIKSRNHQRELMLLKKFKEEEIILDKRINQIFDIKKWTERFILLKLK